MHLTVYIASGCGLVLCNLMWFVSFQHFISVYDSQDCVVLGHSLAICQFVLVSDPLAAGLLVLFGAPHFVVASPSVVWSTFVVLLSPQNPETVCLLSAQYSLSAHANLGSVSSFLLGK